ncbi:MAG: TlpA family protein disulfide reductase [Chitinophagia bacterium]|nr:TlpA family protein disulfide reductase [Chitinophagia bacterium]
MRFAIIAAILLFSCRSGICQSRPGSYVGRFLRADGLPIVFHVEISGKAAGETWTIRNAGERIRVTSIRRRGDSVFIDMPVFESSFRLRDHGQGYTGDWVKAGERQPEILQPVELRPGAVTFPPDRGAASTDITGRWKVAFTRPNGTQRAAIAEFRQSGQRLTGTFLTPTGDYRYLEGVISGDSLQLSCFDGSHAYYFGARLEGPDRILDGIFAAGLTHMEPWTAERDAEASLDGASARMEWVPGSPPLRFRFPDLDSNVVALNDERFRGKVVVLQILGSWCPNCMDETAFLSEYYRKNRGRGVEVIGLAYEYSTDFRRSSRSLAKFRDRFGVEYPMLVTGVTSSDTFRTEKTLPGFTPIRAFPTTIFLGRDGRVRKTEAGYAGPATGRHHEAFRREFEETVDALLRE